MMDPKWVVVEDCSDTNPLRLCKFFESYPSAVIKAESLAIQYPNQEFFVLRLLCGIKATPITEMRTVK